MNKLPLPIAVLSVAVAVVLWYVATLLEGDAQRLDDSHTPELPQAFGGAVGDTPVLGGSAALDCRRAERNMQAAVDDARHCNVDEDCTVFDYGYPIECMTSVAKSDITALRLEYRKYEKSCQYRVYYDCPSEPLEREAVCRNHRCEVELRTLDPLKDETLHHIGIDRTETGGRAPGSSRR